MSALSEVAKAITPGGRVGDSSPLGTPGGKQNWVDHAGGLPTYIREVAHAFRRKGKSESAAIRMAVGVIRNWAEGKGNVSAKVRAAAQATMAKWEAMKGASHVTKSHVSDEDFEEVTKALIGKCGDLHPDCNCSPAKKKAAMKKAKKVAKGYRMPGDMHVNEDVNDTNGERVKADLRPKKKKGKKKVSKAHFNPNEPRDPHTGKWINLPGLSEFKKIGVWEHTDGTHGVYVNGKRSPHKTYKSKGAAMNFVKKEIEKDGKSKSSGKKQNDAVSRSFSQFMSGDEKGARATIRGAQRSRNIQSTASSAGKKTGDFSVGDKVQLVNVRNKKFAGKTASVVEHTGNFLTLQMPNGDRVRVGLNQIQRVKKTDTPVEISDSEFDELVGSLEEEFDADSDTDSFEFSTEGTIEKSDPEKQLVFGWCSIAKDKDGNEIVDKQGDVLEDIDQMEKVAYDFVLHSRDGGEMHIRKGVSTLVESFVSTPEKWAAMGIPEGTLPVGWWVGFKVNDSKVWKAVKDRKYTMFSVHGSGMRKAYEDA